MNAQIKKIDGKLVVQGKEPGSRKRAETLAEFSLNYYSEEVASIKAKIYISDKGHDLVYRWTEPSSSPRSQGLSTVA